MTLTLDGSNAAVQRVARRAWKYGKDTWGWQNHQKSQMHEIIKSVTIAIYEDLENYHGISIDQSTLSPWPKIPNDPEVIV